MKTLHTPGPWLAIFNNKVNEKAATATDITIQVIDDREEHAKNADELTAGHVEFKYIQLQHALAAPELLEACKEAISTIEMLMGDKLNPSASMSLASLLKAIKSATE